MIRLNDILIKPIYFSNGTIKLNILLNTVGLV